MERGSKAKGRQWGGHTDNQRKKEVRRRERQAEREEGETTERERNQVRAGTQEKETEKEKEQEVSIRILKNEDTVNICDKQALAWTELRSKLECIKLEMGERSGESAQKRETPRVIADAMHRRWVAHAHVLIVEGILGLFLS